MATPSTAPTEMKPAKSNRMTMYIAVAVIVIIIVGAAVYVFTQTPTFTPDRTIGIKGNQTNGWNVTTITVSLNQKIRIALISGDGSTHNFVIAYADNVASGTPAAGDLKSNDFSSQTTPYNFDFTATKAGTFVFFCMYHYTVMKGTITIS
jgi:plastocyanin